jgi:hypothetical protein
MADATYAQFNFQGGEVSPAWQGRADDEDYKKSLALCLNYIPNQEGSLTPRSGMRRLGMTHMNSVARLLPFRFSMMYPYVAEFTRVQQHVGNLRFWANGLPVLRTEYANLRSVAGTPPTFTIRDSRSGTNLVPPEWGTGDAIVIQVENFTALKAAPYLANRTYLLNIVSRPAGTITLTDAETATPLSAAITLSTNDLRFYRILDVPTVYEYPEGVRQVQNTVQNVTGAVGGSFHVTPPDHRVTYLYPLARPYSLSADGGGGVSGGALGGVQRGLIPENFVDGPYLDSFGTDIPMMIDAKTGSITLTIHGYDANIIYMNGDGVVDYTGFFNGYFLSLTENNKGNALPAGEVNNNWLRMPVNEEEWSSSLSFDIGHLTTISAGNTATIGQTITIVDNSAKIYYSKTNANTGNNPITSTTNWATTPPTWSIIVLYTAGAFVVHAGIRYLATGVPVLGTDPPSDPTNWIVAPDIATAVDMFTNTRTGWLSAPLFYYNDAGGTLPFSLNLGNPGRLVRLKAGPQPYNSKITYGIGDLVNFNDVIYKSLTSPNLNNNPETDAVNWEIQSTTIKWTWGEITYANDHMLQAIITLKGEDLPDTHAIWEFRFGVYSDTTGWPTCGAYHEGRLWLGGAAPNRLDAGVSNQGFNFTPTAPDGTVSDSNGISLTLNCEENEAVCGLSAITEGLIAFTSEAEWLVSASALNDPLTPTSVQARRTTAFSAIPVEVTRLPTGLSAVQRGGRRVLEYRNFVDMSAYQSRLNTTDLSRKCQHLTAGGVGMTQFQSLSQPVLWCAPAQYLVAEFQPLIHGICSIIQTAPVVQSSATPVVAGNTLFGIAYSRSPEVTYAAPFSFEHGRTLATGYQQVFSSIAIQRGPVETSEYLHGCVTGSDQKSHVEMMMPFFESQPLDDVLATATTVSSYGTVSPSCFLDSAAQPSGCEIAANGLTCKFFGLMAHAGQTVSFTIRGKYVGDFAIASDGTVTVTFSVAPATLFTRSDVYLAMRVTVPSYNLLPASFQTFWLSDLTNTTTSGGPEFLGYFGYKYRRRGKMLRPQIGSQNGPTFAKIVRNDAAGIYVDAAKEVSAGGSFATLVPVKLARDGTRDVRALGVDNYATGIFRVNIKDEYGFNGQICWEQTSPVPGSILGVGGFDVVMDK